MTMALVSLTWEITGEPDSAKKQTAVQLFLQWAMMQGGAMLMQNRYQLQRRLTCVALRRPMEWICLEETVGAAGQLWLLYPRLFIRHADIKLSYFVGCFLVFMAVGNFVSSIEALLTEPRSKVEMKRLKSKAEMD